MARKLIEVALPLDEINVASAREKSMYLGKPASLHMWWAPRSLASARAVLFASLITDPSDPEYPWREGEPREVEQERARLLRLIVDLVQWENSTNERVLGAAKAEIARHTNGNPPPVLDPFAGGGAIPLEAQRLGLEAHASDLNPVAVLINKAMIEIPPKFASQAPVNPDRRSDIGKGVTWKGATGLADDVRFYGKWMRDEAERRIGHLYPKVQLPPAQGGGEATVIAWLWARTVTCPNPACRATMPLVRSFVLSKKKGKEAYVEPIVRPDRSGVDFEVRAGKHEDEGTVGRKGAKCLVCESPVPLNHIRAEGKRIGLGTQPMAIVAEGRGGRAYLSATEEQTRTALSTEASWRPTMPLPTNPRDFKTPNYGLTTFGDLFTERQLVALTTFSDLVGEARERVLADALAASRPSDTIPLAEGGVGVTAYADAVATYLALGVSRATDYNSSTTSWMNHRETLRNQFARQAIPMVWDFAEANPVGRGTGSIFGFFSTISRMLDLLPIDTIGKAVQRDATRAIYEQPSHLVVTDPPYYDNINYADLGDFFYVWLRRTVQDVWPVLFSAILTPKDEELVATPYRFDGGIQEAKLRFEDGFFKTFQRMQSAEHSDYPMIVYYAYKQSETESQTIEGSFVISTGWETMLGGLVSSGYQVSATWPMATEMTTRMTASGTNALGSSMVLACRIRKANAPEATRQQFVRELRQKLAEDLRPLQQANIAPADLRQAAIGPGMAIYSKYARVREASGETLRVRGALALINQALDEVLEQQDEEYDNATRWAISWYASHGMNEGPFGDAEGFARARGVAVDRLAADGLVQSGRGKVRFVWREELPPLASVRTRDIADWTIMQRLAHALQEGQDAAAADKARIEAALPGRTDTARDLAYRIFTIADRKGWSREALVYNTLVQNWAEIDSLASGIAAAPAEAAQSRLEM